MAAHPSDSTAQFKAEPLFKEQLRQLTGLSYSSERIKFDGTYVDVDAVGRNAAGEVVELAEIYARQNRLSGGQLKKPTDDAARLLIARKHKYPTAQLRLAYSTIVVEQIEKSWRGSFLGEIGVQLTPIELDAETVSEIRRAQERQTR